MRLNKTIPANIYLFKVSNRNTRKWCGRCSKLTTKNTRAASMTSFWFFYCWLWTNFPPFPVFLSSLSFPEMKMKRDVHMCSSCSKRSRKNNWRTHALEYLSKKKIHQTYWIVNLMKVFRITFTQNLSEWLRLENDLVHPVSTFSSLKVSLLVNHPGFTC